MLVTLRVTGSANREDDISAIRLDSWLAMANTLTELPKFTPKNPFASDKLTIFSLAANETFFSC